MDTKEKIIDKLKELKLNSTNAFPKKSFMYEEVPSVSLYKRELAENFYFYNPYDEKLYVVPFSADFEEKYKKDAFNGATKYIVPLSECMVIWENKPFEEMEDVRFSDMTLRDYACIKLKVPKSTKLWLNQLIIEAKDC